MSLTTAKERSARLRQLEKAIWKYRKAFQDSLQVDYGKPPTETDLIELYPVLNEIRYARKHLKRWMRPVRVGAPPTLLGSSSWIQYQPKGTVLIISPWNFPVNLSLHPLISAIASGNTVLLKPSEFTPRTAGVLRQMLEEVFPSNEVALVQGDAALAAELTRLPFDHIFFTGSTHIGRKVMAAAATNLTSVTLELGGKSPLLIDRGADLELAIKRAVWAKIINNGQVCIAPDYALVHHSQLSAFTKKVAGHLSSFLTENPTQSPDYGRIVNDYHWERLNQGIRQGLEEGGRLLIGGKSNRETRFIEPTLIQDISLDNPLMTEEIFGPVLPVFTYETLEEAVNFINRMENPLTLHLYSQRKETTQYVLDHTRSGSMTINHSYIQFFNPNLPFGGVNHSGVGGAHGWYGFREFSHARAVAHQRWPFSLPELFFPPYSAWKKRLLEIAMKWV